MDSTDSEMVLYLMLRSVDRFYQQHSRYPGQKSYQNKQNIYIYNWETLNHSTDFKISIKSDFFMLKNPQVFLYTNLNLDLSLFYVFILDMVLW